MGWLAYSEAEDWGESRADNREAANTLWSRNAGTGAILPSLFGPDYFAEMDPKQLAERARALDGEIDRVLKQLEERKNNRA